MIKTIKEKKIRKKFMFCAFTKCQNVKREKKKNDVKRIEKEKAAKYLICDF